MKVNKKLGSIWDWGFKMYTQRLMKFAQNQMKPGQKYGKNDVNLGKALKVELSKPASKISPK